MRTRLANLRFLTRFRRFGIASFIFGLASYQRRRLSQKNSAGPGFPDFGGARKILFDRPVIDSRLLDQDRVLALRVYLNASTKVVQYRKPALPVDLNSARVVEVSLITGVVGIS